MATANAVGLSTCYPITGYSGMGLVYGTLTISGSALVATGYSDSACTQNGNTAASYTINSCTAVGANSFKLVSGGTSSPPDSYAAGTVST